MRKYLSIISVCASLVVTSAYGLGGMVNSTISGTPFPFNVGSVVTNSAYDPNALYWASLSGTTNIDQMTDESTAIRSEKEFGVWGSVIQATVFANRMNGSNNVPVVGNSWIGSNVVFGAYGARCNQSNLYTINLPTLVSNFTVSICYQADISAAMGASFGAVCGLWGMYNTNNGGSVVLSEPSNYNPQTCDSYLGSGTWFGNGGAVTFTSNQVFNARSGVWSYSERSIPIHPIVQTISFNTNGLVSYWYNGNVGVFGNNANISINGNSTNLQLQIPVTTANMLTTLLIGGGGTQWNALGGGSLVQGYQIGIHTNAGGIEVFSVIVHNQSVEQTASNTNIPIADFQWAMSQFKASVCWDFMGDSRLWFPAAFTDYGGQEVPFTNEFSGILQQMRPDLLVMNDAYPGSDLTNYATVGGTFGGRYSFVPSCRWLPQAKFKSLMISDAGANDAAAVAPFTAPQLVATNSLYFLPLITNGLMYAPFTGYPTLLNTYGMIMSQRSYFTSVINTMPCTDVYDPWSQITMNWLSSVSFTGVHIGGTNTIAGYAGAVSLAQFFSYKTPMQLPYNPAYYQVSSGVQNGTNQMSFNLLEPMFRDTNGGVYLSYDGSTFTNLVVSPQTWTNNPPWWGVSNISLLFQSNNAARTAVPNGYRIYYDAGTNAHVSAVVY